MKRLLLTLLAFVLAAPAFAGTVYVPFVAEFQLGGVTFETRVWVTNHDRTQAHAFEYLYIPAFRDGTDREEEGGLTPTELIVPAGETTVLKIGGPRGMFEIYAPEAVQVAARIVPINGEAADQGYELPIVSSDNVVPAGEEAHLLGWERINDGVLGYTNFGLVNLGHDTANCLVDMFRDNSNFVVNDFPMTVNPLSHNMFDQALDRVGINNASDWRAVVTCDQPSFSFASIYYPTTSQMTIISPSASGRSTLDRPRSGGVSDQFDYMSDLPIDRWGGIELRPFVNRTGIDWHPSGGGSPVGGIAPIQINGVTYEKGLSFYGRWSATPFVEYRLDGRYGLFTSTVRVADYYRGRYEWAVVSNDRWVRLERPPEGFRGPERSNPIRVGSALTFQVLGDGEVLYRSPEIYAYGDPIALEIDVTGVEVLRIQTHPAGHERRGAPHRNGLSADRMVSNCPWLDMPSFADPKLFLLR